jgi:2-polyprenyl-3-methyl-5-hydroxy-6-metoxy-1,4-benzoquinol methylase
VQNVLGCRLYFCTFIDAISASRYYSQESMECAKDRREEELAYQAARAKRIAELRPTPERIIERYRRLKLWWVFPKDFAFRQMKALSQKQILDFGCGEGEVSTQLAKLGAYVTGVDISPNLIEVARKRAELDGVQDRLEFLVCDIEDSPLPPDKFDVLFCYAVLHHIDIRSAFPRLLATLKPGGVAIMLEPITFSPWLRRVRNAVPVPKEGGPLDHPLTKEDVNYVTSSLAHPSVRFFDLFTRLHRLFPRKKGNHRWAAKVMICLGAFDRLLLTMCPPLSRFSGSIVIVGERPSR